MAIDVNGITLASSAGTALTMNNGATNWMTVNSNGIITRPQTPYMKAILSGQGSFYRGNPVTFGSVQANVGSCWNNSTGYFTCPVAGTYLAGLGGIAAGSLHGAASYVSYGYFYIMKNGGTHHFSHWNHTSYWEYVSMSGLLYCAVGDTISFQIHPSYGYWYGGGDHGNFFIGLTI